jgi:hypothetical protein
MSSAALVVVILAGLVLIAIAIFARHVIERRRRRSLRARFGTEYDRTLHATGDRKAAERELQRRIDRHDRVQLREIGVTRKDAIRGEWLAVQISFVDDPRRAISRAARLVHDAISERGYPSDDAGEQIDLISVDYPELVPEFRRAHLSTLRGRAGQADTEELRQAFLRYRLLLYRLFESQPADVVRS